MRSGIAQFISVGGVATIVHLLIAVSLKGAFQIQPLSANFVGFSCALIISYIGHTRFTFAIDVKHGFHLPRFLTIAGLGLAASSIIVQVMVNLSNFSFSIAMAVVAVVVPTLTYAALRFWAFRAHQTSDNGIAIGLIASLVPAISFFLYFKDRVINHDTAWYLVATRKWLEGSKLYVDIVEVNPPLNFYYTTPAIWLADLANISDEYAQYAVVASLLLISLLWCWCILISNSRFSRIRIFFVIIGFGFAFFMSGFSHAVQREHILTIFLMPWFVQLLVRSPSDHTRGEVPSAIFAACGICLKPFFLLFPVLLTLALVLHRRSLRPVTSASNVAIFSVGAAYVLYVAIVHPAYLLETIPLAQLVYDYGHPTEIILARIGLLEFGLAMVLFLIGFTAARFISGIALFVAGSMAGLMSYLVQWTGFSYQIIPFYFFVLALCVWTAATVQAKLILRTFSVIIMGCFFLLLSVHGTYRVRQADNLLELLQNIHPYSSIVVFSTYVSIGPQIAFRSDANWASRYPTFWTLPAIANSRSETNCSNKPQKCDALRAVAKDTRRSIHMDLISGQPDLIVIDSKPGYITNTEFSISEFLKSDDEISKFLQRYRKAFSDTRYEILVRKD